MKFKHLIITILALSISCPVYAGIFKNPFKKKDSEVTQQKSDTVEVDSSDPLKARAVYLELEGDSVEYDHESNIYITSGMSTANIIDQDAKLEADEIIYYGDDQHIEAKGNIKIIRGAIVTTGESFRFDVTSNKYLLTKPKTVISGAIIRSRNVYSLPDNAVEYERGRLHLDEPIRIAQGFGSRQHPKTYYSRQEAKASQVKPTWGDVSKTERYRVSAEKIVYDHDKKVNNLTIYGARVHFDSFSLPAVPKFTTTVNSEPNVRSAPLIAPTLGTQGALGGFAIGPAFNFNVTDYHIVSLSPFGQIGSDDYGLGGMIAFYGPTTEIEGSYGSLKDRFIGQLKQMIGMATEFRAAYNRYLDDGFLGRTLAQINVELVDKRRMKLPFTESGVSFRTSTNWSQTDTGLFPSRFRNFLRDSGDEQEFEKSAFKLEEQVSITSQPLFKLGTEKYNTALRLRTRNAFRAYSTGDLQGIFTGGPLLDNTVGPAMFEIGYAQGFVKGDSPLIYDQYIQGMQSVSLDGDVKLHEWVTLGGYGTYNIKAEELVERQFRAKVGPKDFKLLVNWDALRQQTQFGLNFLFGQPVDFERFLILNSQNKSGGI